MARQQQNNDDKPIGGALNFDGDEVMSGGGNKKAAS